MLIRSLDLAHMLLIPMRSDDAVEEQTVLGAHAGHALLEKNGVAHGFVGGGAKLMEEGGSHVAGEFLRWCK